MRNSASTLTNIDSLTISHPYILSGVLMRGNAILLLALILAGCSPDSAEDIVACKTAASRFYASYLIVKPDDPGTKYIIACMIDRGYDFDISQLTCDSRFPLSSQPACYVSNTWMTRLLDRLKRSPRS